VKIYRPEERKAREVELGTEDGASRAEDSRDLRTENLVFEFPDKARVTEELELGINN
jgi:hypothetical protein